MPADNKDLALVQKDDLSLVENNALNGEQLRLLLKKTPVQYVHKRPAKGGGEWEYVTGGYVRKVLNLMFGWDWDFEIMEQMVMHGEAIVKGKLTCRVGGRTIVKMQYGNKDVICKKNTDTPLSIGNDLKSAATDALKKCAAEIGIAADIYNKLDFKEVAVDTSEVDWDDLSELLELKRKAIQPDQAIHMERIIKNKEVKSAAKLRDTLQSI